MRIKTDTNTKLAVIIENILCIFLLHLSIYIYIYGHPLYLRMRAYRILLWFVVYAFVCSSAKLPDKKDTLHIIHITREVSNVRPYDPESVIDYAVFLVNSRHDLLPGYSINVHTFSIEKVGKALVLFMLRNHQTLHCICSQYITRLSKDSVLQTDYKSERSIILHEEKCFPARFILIITIMHSFSVMEMAQCQRLSQNCLRHGRLN